MSQPSESPEPSASVPAGPPPGLAFVPGAGWVRLATTGQRVGARLIDSIVLVTVLGVVFVAGILSLLASRAGSAAVTSVAGPVLVGSGVMIFLATLASVAVIGVLYEVAFVTVKGGTPGKLLLRIRIVDERTGRNIDWGPSLLRWLIPMAANAVCGLLELLVYMSFLWDADARMQGWHDKIAKDLVIQSG